MEHLKAALRSVWSDKDIDEISAEDLCGDYPAVRYAPPTGDVFLDILTRLGTRVQYTDLEYEQIVLDGIPIRVATPRALCRMKRDTERPIDRADAQVLKEVFELDDNPDAG